MEREAVLRALLDAAMEAYPSIDGFSSEEELSQFFLKVMKDGLSKKEL
ncbi:hypothetical protein [Heliorestis convoluta]|uniref:Uncharacterized protein n=1 Tax=Heliorestis convoluta TaxID=356322 RepID=A0A5Q2N1T9_9FIRM|nr:hypothetical protein [Heliorestis convoluta]QGG48261.1 hypothetical protein FTV88_2163 [Heliorestis convoluta]